MWDVNYVNSQSKQTSQHNFFIAKSFICDLNDVNDVKYMLKICEGTDLSHICIYGHQHELITPSKGETGRICSWMYLVWTVVTSSIFKLQTLSYSVNNQSCCCLIYPFAYWFAFLTLSSHRRTRDCVTWQGITRQWAARRGRNGPAPNGQGGPSVSAGGVQRRDKQGQRRCLPKHEQFVHGERNPQQRDRVAEPELRGSR